ncbi:unnamed protein product, partial [Ectocarpus fasciculatus]
TGFRGHDGLASSIVAAVVTQEILMKRKQTTGGVPFDLTKVLVRSNHVHIYIDYMSINHGPQKNLFNNTPFPRTPDLYRPVSLHHCFHPSPHQLLRHTNALNAPSQVSLPPPFFLPPPSTSAPLPP